MKFRKVLTLAASLVVASLALSACGGGGSTTSDSNASPKVLTLGTSAGPTSFDPGQAQEGHPIPYYQAVYDTLIRRAPDGAFEPMLAESWDYNTNATELTLQLRKDVKFSDGTAFDAAAAKANLDSFRTGTGPQAATLKLVTEVIADGDSTLKLELSAPEPGLLFYLSNAAGFMGSPAALGTEAIKTEPVGSGPYILDLKATTTGSEYTFVKNKHYWAPELQHYDKIVMKPMSDITARINALVSGQIDGTLLDPKTADQADKAGLVEHSQTSDWSGLVIADRGGKIVPALGDVKVRQAINYALDRESILKQLQRGRGEETTQIFGTASSAFVESLDKDYTYDPKKAKKLLAEAGYADGFTVQIPNPGFDQALIAVLSDQLGAVGIKTEIVEVPGTQYISEISSGKYPIFWMSLFQPSTWVTINQAVAPAALFNPFHYEDDKVSALITDIQTATDDATDKSKSQELNKYLVEQGWFNTWYRRDSSYYTNKKVDVDLQVEQAIPSIYNYRPAK